MSSHVAAQVTNPWLVHMARITAIRHEVADVLTYELQWTDSRTAFPGRPKSSSYSFLPGQFNMLYVPSCGEVAISMSGSPRTAHNTVVHHSRRRPSHRCDCRHVRWRSTRRSRPIWFRLAYSDLPCTRCHLAGRRHWLGPIAARPFMRCWQSGSSLVGLSC